MTDELRSFVLYNEVVKGRDNREEKRLRLEKCAGTDDTKNKIAGAYENEDAVSETLHKKEELRRINGLGSLGLMRFYESTDPNLTDPNVPYLELDFGGQNFIKLRGNVSDSLDLLATRLCIYNPQESL